jgi:hypothetical protein
LNLQGIYCYLKLGSSFVTGIWADGKLRHFKDIYSVGKFERWGGDLEIMDLNEEIELTLKPANVENMVSS